MADVSVPGVGVSPAEPLPDVAGVSVPDVGAPAEPLPDVVGVSLPGVTPVVPPLVAELSVGVVVFAAAWAGSSATLIPKIVTPSRTDATPTFNFRRP